ncbi:MAG: hypothetical protein M0Z77_10325 [Thermoplasmatales archaeon]|jgi:hypothetical protein|nr:hypothetical protein [Candidatus Thermoplasmatota archaeon]MCL6003347.1 hypothetical protein [Candidatus Thermoplasmatota archaeon]MDA8056022.1 hypothetical protein [Thermoplasmatales archaeon]
MSGEEMMPICEHCGHELFWRHNPTGSIEGFASNRLKKPYIFPSPIFIQTVVQNVRTLGNDAVTLNQKRERRRVNEELESCS